METGLDLGEITLFSGKTTVKNERAELPWWYLDSFFRGEQDKDEEDEKPEEPDDEVPDYSHLPYREPKTMAELVELNGGEQPDIYMRNNSIGLYIGKVSENKIKNVDDAICEMNCVAEILNLFDN